MTTMNKQLITHSQEVEKYLSFKLGEETYSINLTEIRQVIAIPDVTAIPFTPDYFLGVMNLRGQIITVIDLSNKLEIKSQSGEENAVIICELNSTKIGFKVQAINSVVAVNPDNILPPPQIEGKKNVEFINGVYQKDHHVTLILNTEKLLNTIDLTNIKIVETAEKSSASQ